MKCRVYIPLRTAIYSPMIGCVIVKQVKISDMKISELIKELRQIKREHGDLHVWRTGYEDMTGMNIKIIHSDEYHGLMII